MPSDGWVSEWVLKGAGAQGGEPVSRRRYHFPWGRVTFSGDLLRTLKGRGLAIGPEEALGFGNSN